ncbi:hypothetical protein ATO3_18490 [Marinibacterium profundimaris]|uniref:Carbohydrate kinase n=1 Tax=Marinibacterium profundimaris TaxID=1679460 RepID=A0A225NER1_9RHOB|nr:hypothetical protein ATO3_18490 [Marinibacterium profundimaris]
MTAERILGVDVGTTSVKAGMMDLRGNALGRFASGYPTQRPGGPRAEQDAGDWIRLVEQAIATLADGAPVQAVGLTSQVNTHLFVGADGAPLMPAIVWQDTRASAEAAELDASVSDAQKIAWWGAPMPIDASNVLSRMLWVARHRPDVWAATRWVMLPKDFIIYRLTGEVTTDPVSNIGLVGPDMTYVDAVFDLVPGARDKAPALVPVTEVTGRVRAGPLAGVPVISGTMDAWTGLVGCGGARDRSTVYLSGTSEVMGISSREGAGTPGVIVFPQVEGIRVHAAPTQSGGDALAWYTQMSGRSHDEVSALAAGPRRAGTPLFLPQLEGERAPLWDAGLRGAFLGLTRRTGDAEMARAVLEGVALSARHALEAARASAAIGPGPITCGGGGFRSAPWAQIRADVLGCELSTLAEKDPGILGAAMLAAVGAGVFDAIGTAWDELARFDATYAPDPGLSGLYDDLFGLYCEAVTTHGALGQRLAGMSE